MAQHNPFAIAKPKFVWKGNQTEIALLEWLTKYEISVPKVIERVDDACVVHQLTLTVIIRRSVITTLCRRTTPLTP